VGAYLYYIKGQLNPATFRESRTVQTRLVKMIHQRHGALYVDTSIR